jgi:hypothetical protein
MRPLAVGTTAWLFASAAGLPTSVTTRNINVMRLPAAWVGWPRSVSLFSAAGASFDMRMEALEALCSAQGNELNALRAEMEDLKKA